MGRSGFRGRAGLSKMGTPCDQEGVRVGPIGPRPFTPPRWALLPTWSGSLAEAPGNGLSERRSCPRFRPQCVGHGPGPGPAPRRPHTLCAKLAGSGRPDRSSNTLAAAITWLWVAAARWRPLVAQRRLPSARGAGRKPGFPQTTRELWALTVGYDPLV